MEGSPRAVDRTASSEADASVGFNVSRVTGIRYRNHVCGRDGDGGREQTPVPAERRENFSEVRWYHGL